MDIQHLVDRLEDLVNDGGHLPFSTRTMIDEQRALEIIDQMRISIPEEIESARRVYRERDRVIAQANEEAARIRQLAREKSETLIQRDSVTKAAQARASRIIEQARQEADAIKHDADQYVMDVLSDLEDALMRTLGVVRNGIQHVQQKPEITGKKARDERALEMPALETEEARPIERVSGGRS